MGRMHRFLRPRAYVRCLGIVSPHTIVSSHTLLVAGAALGLGIAPACGSRSAVLCSDGTCQDLGSAENRGGGGHGGRAGDDEGAGNSPPADAEGPRGGTRRPDGGLAGSPWADAGPADGRATDGMRPDAVGDGARGDGSGRDAISPNRDGANDAPADGGLGPDAGGGETGCKARELCGNRFDDDCSGAADCADLACASDPQCAVTRPETCDNGVDDDGNGLVDCADPSCSGFPECFTLGTEVCNNGIDDDDDGLADCADPSCSSGPWCTTSSPEVCGNRIDDNGDGLVDCADPQCSTRASCLATGCVAEVDFGRIAARGASVTRTISTVGAVSSFQTCAVPGGSAQVARFELESATDLRIAFEQPSSAAHVIAVFRAGANQLCDQNPVQCLKAGQEPSSSYSIPALSAGTYWLIVQSYPYTQGKTTVTLSTGSLSQSEVCHNGVDDDGNGLVDCVDSACQTDSLCGAITCEPDENVGALVVDGPSSRVVAFDTRGQADRYHPLCAGTSVGGDYAIHFSLKEPAAVTATWWQAGANVLALYKMPGPGVACDASANRAGCYYSAGTNPTRFIWTALPAGEYVAIIKAESEAEEGTSTISFRATSNRDTEACGNGIDDDGDGRIDCDDEDCFGLADCSATMCLPAEDLGHFVVGTAVTRTVDTTGAPNLYRTKCGHGDGGERVLRLTIDEPMGLHIRCGGAGDNILQLAAQLRPLDACDSQLLLCADPSRMICNFTSVNLQPGQYNLIVEAFQNGGEGVTELALSGVRDAMPEVCNNGVDDDGDGFTDCADLKCVALPACANHRCVPDSTRLITLDGNPTWVTLDTAKGGDDQAAACVSTLGGQDAVLAVEIPARADLSVGWVQGGNHVVALYANDNDLLACDGGTSLGCFATGGAKTGAYQLSGVPAGKYYIVVDAVGPGQEGGVILDIAASPAQ